MTAVGDVLNGEALKHSERELSSVQGGSLPDLFISSLMTTLVAATCGHPCQRHRLLTR